MEQKELDQLARLALHQYERTFSSINFFAKETSTIYKVVDSHQQEYALKIYEEASSNEDDNQIEILILDAIKEKGTIQAPEIITNRLGEKLTYYQDAVFTNPRRISVTKWLKGEDLNDNESELAFINLGKLMGELHLILKNIKLPEGITPKKWDKVLYFRDEEPNYKKKKNSKKVDEEFIDVIEHAIPILDTELKRIYIQEPPQLLHGDINPWNIKLEKEKLSILDFEDAIYGPRIHELAIMLYYYKEDKRFSYKLVKDRVLEGYLQVNPIKEYKDSDIEILMLARLANFLNYVLILEGDFEEFIKKGKSKLKSFIEA
ncbi:phosphotransferase enzyme family protein [Aquimarina algicola]|uniref:phosphotransferase enzyme family protein n=1 Tax=Aquimarina algicola TaxID=2589995 RepID=UPI001CF3C1C7|nr:phosphotransferase [Aquimarina algicola]